MTMTKTIRRRYDLPEIDAAQKEVTHTIELDKHAQRIRGILLVADRDEMPFHRGTLQAWVAGEEAIPENFHAKLLMSGLAVPPKDRHLPLDHATGNRQVKVTYTDNPSPVQAHSAYTVSLYLEVEIAG